MSQGSIREICILCKSDNINKFLSLGPMPLANAFISKEYLSAGECFYPLDVYFCENCFHVGILPVVPPKILFQNYVYMTSMSKTMLAHLKGMVDDIKNSYLKGKTDSLIIDVGSNDGSLLGIFKKQNFRVLGIEPAKNIANVAEKNGIPTVNEFFNEDTSKKIVEKYGKAHVITATNVFAHVADLDGFTKGVVNLLDNEGVFVFENAYLVDLIKNVEFDTIYHEHLCYYAVNPLVTFFKRFGLEIVDVERRPIHGGSIRVFVRKKNTSHPSDNVGALLDIEREVRLHSFETYKEFAERVKNVRMELVSLLRRLKLSNKKIVGYGASAKGTILLNYCRIGTDVLDYIVDITPFKQYKYTPGMHIPIKPSVLKEKKPDYILLLAWNFAEEILKKKNGFWRVVESSLFQCLTQ